MSLLNVPREILDVITNYLAWKDLLKLRLTSATANNALSGVLHTRAATFTKLFESFLRGLHALYGHGLYNCVKITHVETMMTAGGRAFSHIRALNFRQKICYRHSREYSRLNHGAYAGYRLQRWLDKHKYHTNITGRVRTGGRRLSPIEGCYHE